jgi:hypothetical protein
MPAYIAPAFLPLDVRNLRNRFGLRSILTTGDGNTKTAKSKTETVILHHLPERSLRAAIGGQSPTAVRSAIPGLRELAESTDTLAPALVHNGCPWSSRGCAEGCLAFSGHGGLSIAVTAARARRTLAMLSDPQAYARSVVWEIAAAYASALRNGSALAVRLRGTDDHAWHTELTDLSIGEAQSIARRYGAPVIPGDGQTITEVFQACGITFYDYSKAPIEGPLGLIAQKAAGFDVTASLTADRPGGLIGAIQSVKSGFRLAVPVALPKGAPIPSRLSLRHRGTIVSLDCVDGDTTDERFLDPAGCAVILRTKRSRGADPATAKAFSLLPSPDGVWQALRGGGQVCLSW